MQNSNRLKYYPIKKLVDWLSLFIEVNTELIEDDLDKKKRNKKTRRHKISKEFKRATELMQNVL